MDAYTALALGIALKSTQKRKRRKWAQQWYLCRERFGHVPLLNELRISEPDVFKNFLRMDGESFDKLLDLVRPYITKENTVMRSAISPFERLSITLRFLATGNTFEDLKFLSAISPQAIGGIVIDTCNAINTCLQSYIKMPQTAEEWKELSNDFNKHWNIPHCIGALDGKHVSIKKPIGSGSFYYNYKKHCSIVLLAVVNAKYEFIMVDAGMNGRVSDGGVMSHTKFGSLMEHGELQLPGAEPLHEGDSIDVPYFFVADDAFAMNENLLKPYSVMGNDVLDQERRVFNYRLSRGRRIVENVFGILVSRFGVFQRPMLLSPEKATTVTLTCCYLHNFLRKQSSGYMAPGSVDWEDNVTHELHSGEWRSKQRTSSPTSHIQQEFVRKSKVYSRYYEALFFHPRIGSLAVKNGFIEASKGEAM